MRTGEKALKTLAFAWKRLNLGEKVLLLLALILGASLSALDLVGIALMGLTVSIASGNTQALTGVFEKIKLTVDSWGFPNSYAVIAAVAIAFFALKTLFSLAVNYATSVYIARLEAKKSQELFESVMFGNFDQSAKWSENQISYGVTSASSSAFNKSFSAFSSLIVEAVLLITIASYLATVHLGAFLTMVGFFGALALVMYLTIVRRMGKLAGEATQKGVKAGDLVYEAMANFRQIYASGQRANFVKNFGETRGASTKTGAKLSVLTIMSRYITEVALMLGLGLLLLQRTIVGGSGLPASTIAIFVVGALRIIASMVPLQGYLGTIRQVDQESKMARDIAAVYANGEQAKRVPLANPNFELDLSAPEINLRGVSYVYSGETESALKNINLDIPHGEFLAVVGKSGSGKSTFADILLGLRSPSEGTVSVSGIGPYQVVKNFPGTIGYVPQRTQLINGTVVENITFDKSGAFDEEKLNRAIRVANLAEVIEALPDGVLTQIGPQQRSLSGGQIQRVGLARAIYMDPKILVLDEATSALDNETESIITQALIEGKHRLTLIVIAHRLETIASADRIVKFDAGQVETFADLIQMKESLKRGSDELDELLKYE
jgi:ATP-binding cassette, subfamily B, bacterial PglK